ncbi:MAG: hypothetical protein HY909_11630 [Deltaproteobacteria bacterium]|nr:hypothetical protein [Deltaproteobacteria bacterium]
MTLILALAGCGSPGAASDAGRDTAGDTEAAAAETGPVELLPRCEDNGDLPDRFTAPSTLVSTIAPGATRVSPADPQVNPSTEAGELRYRALGLDRAVEGAGEPHLRRATLGDAMVMPAAARRSLGFFVHLSDFQLADDESPTRAALADNPVVTGGLRPQEAYLPRAMSAMNRTLAALARPERRFAFGIVTGDCADSAQRNELRWMMAILDGAPGVRTDSGERNELLPGPDNDPKDPFDAVAFPAPWLYVPGNHDVEVIGVFAPDMHARAQALGDRAPLGTRDYTRRWAPVTTREVPPDPERRILSRAEIVEELLAGPAAPGPPGHGYRPGMDVSDGANYAVDALPGLLRVLTLDTNDPAGGSEGLVRRGTVERFLRPELERAERDGVLVLLASHHATTAIDTNPGQFPTTQDPEAVAPSMLEALVVQHPSVIGWLVGHNHRHRIRPIQGPDLAHPGYWEVMTSALSDWPAQARVLELVDNGNGTLSLFATVVDYQARSCLERRFRRLSLLDSLSGWGDRGESAATDRNVELVIPLPASAALRVAAAGERAPSRIESETTLRGMR